MLRESIKVRAPATVANVSCGFDCLGYAISDPADIVTISKKKGGHAKSSAEWHAMFTNLNLTDMETCYKVFRGEVIKKILPRLKQNRFGIEPEITARVARQRYRIYEVAISYSGRTYGEGKKIGIRDGFSALWCIVRYGMFR